jgi:hypothetical protein
VRFVRVVVGLTVAVVVSGLAPGAAAADPFSASDTEQELRGAGFQEVRVFYSFADDTEAVVVRHEPAPAASRFEAAGSIASIVWRTEELRFEEVVVLAGPGDETSFGVDHLAAMLGPRPAEFDQRSISPWGTGVPVLGLGRDPGDRARDAVTPFRLWAIVAVVMAAAIWLVVLGLAVAPVRRTNDSTLFS